MVTKKPGKDPEETVELVAQTMFRHNDKQVFPGHRLTLTLEEAGRLRGAHLVAPYHDIAGFDAPPDASGDVDVDVVDLEDVNENGGTKGTAPVTDPEFTE